MGSRLWTTVAILRIFLDIPEEEVAKREAQNHGQAQPIVEVHEDQHEQVGDDELDEGQEGLYDVRHIEDALPIGLILDFGQLRLRTAVAVAQSLATLLLGQLLSLLTCFTANQLNAQKLQQLVQERHREEGNAGEGELGNGVGHPTAPQNSLAVAAMKLWGRERDACIERTSRSQGDTCKLDDYRNK